MLNFHTATKRVAEAIRDGDKRVVVIVGAGASVDAGIPTGEEVGGKFGEADQSILRHELKKEPDCCGFFDVIDVLKKFRGEDYVRDELRKILKVRYVSLGYEILAHYLHHGQINAVVSLNHDGAFDESLKLESPEFENVARSRSEFDALLGKIQEAQEKKEEDGLPQAYLKVHGCVSRKMTFRIDRESVAQLEPEKLGVLRQYFEKADLILCIGWSLHDSDVFRPLANIFPSETKNLIVVDKDANWDLQKLVKGFKQECCKSTASKFLSRVGDKVENTDEGSKQPPSVSLHRHVIRALCFGEQGRLKVDDRTKAAIEVIMFALKARAQIKPRILFECGRTSQLLAKAGEKLSRNTAQAQVLALADILGSLTGAEILKCHDGGIGSAYWLQASGKKDLEKKIAKNIVSSLMKPAFRRKDHAKAADIEKWRSKLSKYFVALTTVFDVDLIPRASDFAMFSEPEVIDSKDRFEAKTAELIGRLDAGKSLHVSTDTGEWIKEYVEGFPKKGIECCRILVEDYDAVPNENPFKHIAAQRNSGVVAELEKKKIKKEVRKLSNKVHQLTAVFDGKRCCAAIYFRREGKSPRISPVWLTCGGDLELVGRIWEELWTAGKK